MNYLVKEIIVFYTWPSQDSSISREATVEQLIVP